MDHLLRYIYLLETEFLTGVGCLFVFDITPILPSNGFISQDSFLLIDVQSKLFQRKVNHEQKIWPWIYFQNWWSYYGKNNNWVGLHIGNRGKLPKGRRTGMGALILITWWYLRKALHQIATVRKTWLTKCLFAPCANNHWSVMLHLC